MEGAVIEGGGGLGVQTDESQWSNWMRDESAGCRVFLFSGGG
jgi:hypothetical protein